jgi:hypothetical protein
MGYVHDTQMVQMISPFQCGVTAGTWTPTIASNVVSNVRTAADANFTLLIPILLPQNSGTAKGAYLTSVDVYYKIATAACDDIASFALNRVNLKASGTAIDGTAIAATADAGHDTAAERKAVADHTMTVTVDAPLWIGSGDIYVFSMVVDAAATTVFSFFGARANYTLRV